MGLEDSAFLDPFSMIVFMFVVVVFLFFVSELGKK